MRPSLGLTPVLLLTTSCGLFIDFAEEGTPSEREASTAATSTSATAASGSPSSAEGSTGSQSAGGGGSSSGSGAGGAGGATPSLAWADTYWAADPGAPARIRTMVVDRETTWLGGYFAGSELRRATQDGTEEVIFATAEDALDLRSFVVALDAAGDTVARIPLATSVVQEHPTDEYLSASIVPAGDGSVFLLTSYRDGELLLDGVSGSEAESVGHGWNLVVARLEADGAPRWAMRCAATPRPETMGADLSAVYGGMAIVGDRLMVGTTYSIGADTVECEALVGDAMPCSVDALGPTQAALVFAVAPEDGACEASPLHIHSPSHSLWLGGLRSGLDGQLFVTGQVSGDGSVLEPWGAELAGGDSIAFRAQIGVDGEGDDDDVGRFVTNWYPSIAGNEEVAAGSPRNAAGASDVAIFVGDRTWTFGDPDERKRSEVALSVSAEGGDVLLTGYMTEDATMRTDLCGEGCEGDLAEHDPCATTIPGGGLPECDPETEGAEACEAPGILERDAYWLLVADEESAPRAAVGRAFGACGDQAIVAGHLGAESVSLVVEMTGNATIDVIDGTLPVTVPDGRIGSVVVRMPRPSTR